MQCRACRLRLDQSRFVRTAAEYAHWINLLDTALHRRNPTELAVIVHFLADLSSGKGSDEQATHTSDNLTMNNRY